jgi:hypothetical protein
MTTLPERNELERLPGSGLGVRPSREAHRVLDEPAYGRPFLCSTGFQLIEELFVDGDRCSHDALAYSSRISASSDGSFKRPCQSFEDGADLGAMAMDSLMSRCQGFVSIAAVAFFCAAAFQFVGLICSALR